MTPLKKSPRTVLGIVLVLLSAVGLAAQNVVSRVFFVPSLIFGRVTFGGFITSELSNVVMLLAIRMAMMAVLLMLLVPWLHPGTFIALKRLPRSPKVFSAAIGSGLCIFGGLTCLYTALSQIAAGVAIAAFFIYPAITVLLARVFFNQRLRPHQLTLMIVIFIGVILTNANITPAASTDIATTFLGLRYGLWAGLGAGLCFGLYGIFAELCLQDQDLPLHPVPFSLVTFIGVSSLATLSLSILPPVSVLPATWPLILMATLFSAGLTLVAYVLNNFGIRYIGASLTALISASSPALTALFAWVTLQESLQPQQNAGVALVTIGVAILSLKAKA
ncbi:conserved domain protein [Synechococcus sp. PCC 7335]|uniref:DMT family transporter n=1 Tax=Synechococcus sp. (strain ATCC 29403 / PCC 7335) TaxID=91464 RepID=UPI00017ED5BD|nr:DMT family transporter [Synechococcus sp. PCC 7335]EDX84593.1 conserved domain protein [Synechococcus sp. PCC 7335]